MAENRETQPPAPRPRRQLRNYLVDRRFQLKYSLILSGASAFLMAAMGALLYVRMQDSERRLKEEASNAHRGINEVAEQAVSMLRREMEISAQQMINSQIPSVVPPACPPAETPPPSGAGTTASVVLQGTGAVCDVETCRPLCEALGIGLPGGTQPAGSPAAEPAPGPPELAAASAEPTGDGASAEQDRPVSTTPSATLDAREWQRDRIRKIEEAVRAETELRARKMEEDTRRHLSALDRDTQARLADLRQANRRDQRSILLALVVTFVVLVAVGIVVTHKVVGPIYRMKMLFRKVDGDHLVLEGRLRRGDELQDLFEEAQRMLDRLRDHRAAEVAALDELLLRLDSASEAERGSVRDDIEKFRDRMAMALERR